MVKSGMIGASAALFLMCTAGSVSAASVPSASLGDVAKSGIANIVQDVQYRGRGGVRAGRYYGGRHYGRRGGWGRGVGAGVAAGVIGGLIGGALINSQPAYGAPAYGAPVYGEPVYAAPGGGAVEYCMRRYRSYDPRTGTYVGYDGVERPCP